MRAFTLVSAPVLVNSTPSPRFGVVVPHSVMPRYIVVPYSVVPRFAVVPHSVVPRSAVVRHSVVSRVVEPRSVVPRFVVSCSDIESRSDIAVLPLFTVSLSPSSLSFVFVVFPYMFKFSIQTR